MDSRTTILDAASRLFARQGFAGVSLRAIAERVGITKPSLLYHFASKDLLRESVLDQLFDHWATTLPRLLKAVTSGEGQFEALMQELTAFFREDPDRALLLLRELLDRPEDIRRRIGDALAPLVTLIADYMRRGQTAGLVRRDVDPESYILHMIGLTLATAVSSPLLLPLLGSEGDPTGTERHFRELMRIGHASLFEHPEAGPPPAGKRRQT